MELIEAVKNILREYDNMVELEAPVRKILLEKVPIPWMGLCGGKVSINLSSGNVIRYSKLCWVKFCRLCESFYV